MNIICNNRIITDHFRTKAKLREVREAGFDSIAMNMAAVCNPHEYQMLRVRNFKREDDFYLTEEPERLREEANSLIITPAEDAGLKVPIAMAPYAASDISLGKEPEQAASELNRIYTVLAKETLKAAIEAGSRAVIIKPLFAGLSPKEEWEANRSFYLELDALAKEIGSDIRILLTNNAKNINGHLVRGICAEPEEACRWVDELNLLTADADDAKAFYRRESTTSGEKSGINHDFYTTSSATIASNPRFAFCFDVGIGTLCGQNLYETMTPLGERLEAVIIRDCDGIHDVSMLPFSACIRGQQTDWLGLIRALRKLEFDGDLIIDFAETYGSYSDRLKPHVLRLAFETANFLVWQITMEQTVKKYQKRVLFGAGNMCRAYMKDYGEKYPPLFTCDNNSARWGEEFCGLTIENPEKLKELSDDVAIFICNIYYDEITEQFRDMGLKNPIERFNDEYMATFHMDRLKMAKDPLDGK